MDEHTNQAQTGAEVSPKVSPKVWRWVSCGVDVEWSTARYRHITRQMSDAAWVDTLCGATGTPGALRTNTRKPRCPDCMRKVGMAS